ncbi:MAG: hypothetical protein ACK4HV_07070, partial [Parachlamydiaceae bacterium]
MGMLSLFRSKTPDLDLIEALDAFEMKPVYLHKIYDEIDLAKSLLTEKGEIKRKAIALLYRLEKIPLTSADPHFIEMADVWKKGQQLLWNQPLTLKEKKAMEEASTYSYFVDLIDRDKSAREKFLNWTIRDHLPPALFIEYPHLAELINDYALNGRIGTVSGNHLKIEKRGKGLDLIKTVTLPFEGRNVEILDLERIIVFKGGMKATIRQIFELFKDKPNRFVDVEYFAQGITNWNSQHLGYYDEGKKGYESINLEQKEWWRQLPPLEILNQEEAKERYGAFINGFNWCVAAKAARSYLNLSYEKCHAYLEIAIPNPDRSYNIYEFGKFARLFPYGVFETMMVFTITTPGTVAYPDENIYHTARQQAGYGFSLNHFQGLLLMDELKKDIEEARKGNMVFQVETENCAKWIQNHLENILGKANVPNLFRYELIKTDIPGIVG